MLSQLFGFIMANVCIIISEQNATYGITMLALSAMGAAIFSIFLREKLKK